MRDASLEPGRRRRRPDVGGWIVVASVALSLLLLAGALLEPILSTLFGDPGVAPP
jgi:hypothetical protein